MIVYATILSSFPAQVLSANHNILITNIPVSSLLYGFIYASIYKANATPQDKIVLFDSAETIIQIRFNYAGKEIRKIKAT
ncbi:hypothetical protein YC2023_122584 [Brassica napus]